MSDDVSTHAADDEALDLIRRLPVQRPNPALAPRSPKCTICKEVGAIEHVALMLWDEEGQNLPTKPVAAYLRSLGMAGTPQAVYNKIVTHRRHIERWMDKGGHVIPAQQPAGVVTPVPQHGPVRWLDAQQNAIDLGNEALRDLAVRLSTGAMETNEVIALARLGVSAAGDRGRLEQKGKALQGIDKLLQLAAGGGASAERT